MKEQHFNRRRLRRSIIRRKWERAERRGLTGMVDLRRVIRRPQQFIMAQLDPAEWMP